MFKHHSGDRWLGLLATVGALLLIFVWVPLDVDTGLIEKVRRQVTLGDSLAPVVAGSVILIGGLMVLLQPAHSAPHLRRANVVWLCCLLLVIATAFLFMRHVGPALFGLFHELPYRVFRATPPWNYVGYLLGGTTLVSGLIAVIRGRLSISAVLIGFSASLLIALGYDLPFDDLQLPPNGDV